MPDCGSVVCWSNCIIFALCSYNKLDIAEIIPGFSGHVINSIA